MMLIVANLRLVGFFDAVAEVAIGRLGARHLLPAVIFTSGVLSAFFVNDIICLVMVPFVLHLTRRMGLPPLAYLLAPTVQGDRKALDRWLRELAILAIAAMKK